jgi:hypothetical protein
MRKLFALALLAALAFPAVAGDTGDGYECQNHCPLAQQANTHRAPGTEAVAASAVVRADVARVIERNLDRI